MYVEHKDVVKLPSIKYDIVYNMYSKIKYYFILLCILSETKYTRCKII